MSEMTSIAIMLDHLRKSFAIVTNPYYQSKMVVCATKMNGVEIASRPDDVYVIEEVETRETFFELVRESFNGPVAMVAKSLYMDVSYVLTILNGVCTLHLSPDVKYKAQYTIEKGVKLNEDINITYDVTTDSYTVKTVSSTKRKARYETKQPKGESYDRVIVCLSDFGPMTTADIALKIGVPENRISGRVSEMCKCGLIRKSGYKTVDGRKQTIWSLVKKDKKSKMSDWNLD